MVFLQSRAVQASVQEIADDASQPFKLVGFAEVQEVFDHNPLLSNALLENRNVWRFQSK